jgi:uncharacterized repeat protein (TIGR03803 family)
MSREQSLLALRKAFLVVAVGLMSVSGAWAASEFKVLHDVSGGLWSGVSIDANGNLYGASLGGGPYSEGAIFELTPSSKGSWNLIVLQNFDGTDGGNPNGGLILDAAGNLYGTAAGGEFDGGEVFELTPGSGGWALTVLYSLGSGQDGWGPVAGLIWDQAGNLYGTTGAGGIYDEGTVFELAPASGEWNESILYSFGSSGSRHDGLNPLDALIWDKAGNLYGTTEHGGIYGGGTVFKLTQGSGGWNEQLLHQFGRVWTQGGRLTAGLVFDNSGNLYGTTYEGGSNACEGGCGTVFKLTHGSGGWNETVLYDFPKPGNGSYPSSGVVFDKAGNLYGEAAAGGTGGCDGGCGVVYKMTPAHGRWTYTVLHNFNGAEGMLPEGGLVFDPEGNLYGTAYNIVFEITP